MSMEWVGNGNDISLHVADNGKEKRERVAWAMMSLLCDKIYQQWEGQDGGRKRVHSRIGRENSQSLGHHFLYSFLVLNLSCISLILSNFTGIFSSDISDFAQCTTHLYLPFLCSGQFQYLTFHLMQKSFKLEACSHCTCLPNLIQKSIDVVVAKFLQAFFPLDTSFFSFGHPSIDVVVAKFLQRA